MSSDTYVNEKGPVAPSNDSDADIGIAEVSSAEDLALEKRVLRKTDMVVLPMVREYLTH